MLSTCSRSASPDHARHAPASTKARPAQRCTVPYRRRRARTNCSGPRTPNSRPVSACRKYAGGETARRRLSAGSAPSGICTTRMAAVMIGMKLHRANNQASGSGRANLRTRPPPRMPRRFSMARFPATPAPHRLRVDAGALTTYPAHAPSPAWRERTRRAGGARRSQVPAHRHPCRDRRPGCRADRGRQRGRLRWRCRRRRQAGQPTRRLSG